jgi:hypothetical protein
MFPAMIGEALKYPDSPKICLWTGTDALLCSESPIVYDFKNVVHVTDTPWLIHTMHKRLSPVSFLPIPCAIQSSPLPYPKDPAILMYLNNHAARDINRSTKLIARTRDIPIYILHGKYNVQIDVGHQENLFYIDTLPDEELLELYSKISLYVRLMLRDGMSQLIVEMKSLGRHVVTTVLAPHCELVSPDQSPHEIYALIKQTISHPPAVVGTEFYRNLFNLKNFQRVLRGLCHAKGWGEQESFSLDSDSQL